MESTANKRGASAAANDQASWLYGPLAAIFIVAIFLAILPENITTPTVAAPVEIDAPKYEALRERIVENPALSRSTLAALAKDDQIDIDEFRRLAGDNVEEHSTSLDIALARRDLRVTAISYAAPHTASGARRQ